MQNDYEATYEEFWKPIFEGMEVDELTDAIKRELHDYHTLLENMPKFVEYATFRQCSNPFVELSVLKSLHDDGVTEAVEDFIRDIMEESEDE